MSILRALPPDAAARRPVGFVPMKKCKLEFSSHTANLALMRNAVRNFLVGYDFSE
jgi:hypothetical protein